MIEFQNVTKIYDNGAVALKNVNLEINKGEFVFVVGASGAGKSTFLKLIIREEVPSGGIIKVGNYVLNDLKRKEIPQYRRNLGIVFQDFRLIQTMNVYDNVAFAMRVIGAPERDIKRRVSYVLSLVGLENKFKCKPEELSGGEQQRVALARALANRPSVIIADEPTGNIDPMMSREIVRLLMKLNEDGTTVVMVTHEHSLVRNYEKRVIILENGCVVKDGIHRRKEQVTGSTETTSLFTEQEDPSSRYAKLGRSATDLVSGVQNVEKPEDRSISSTDQKNADSITADQNTVSVKFGDADSCHIPLPYNNDSSDPLSKGGVGE